MSKTIAGSWLAAAALLSQIVLVGGVAAQEDYPTRAVTIIVPTGPGGPTDSTARSVAKALSQKLGKPFVVENRAGAQGLVAMTAFTKVKPDGYTLLLMATSQAVLPALYELPYDPVKDITPIARLSTSPATLLINRTVPANTLLQFVSYAKQHPGEITYGYQGGPPQLLCAMFAKTAGFEALGVPFRASSQSLMEVVAGRLTYTIVSPIQAKTQVDAGTLRAIAMADKKRADAFPDVPTLEELGYPLYGTGWFGLVGPPGLPDEITEILWKTIQDRYLGKTPQKELDNEGLEPASDGPKQFQAIIAEEVSRWQNVAAELGIKRERP